MSGHSTSLCSPSSASPGSGIWPSATPSTCTPWPAPPGQPGEEISQLKEENSDEIWIVFALLSIVAEVLLMKRPPTLASHYQIEPIKVFSVSTHGATPMLLQPLLTDLSERYLNIL